MSGLLTRRAVLLAGVETTYNTALSLGGGDGFLVENPDYRVDPTVLERNFARADLSPLGHIVGRKLARMTFRTELRGNGRQHGGELADAPLIARLFRACGYALDSLADPAATAMVPIGQHANDVAWTVAAGVLETTDVIAYYLEVTTGGASGTAEIAITSDSVGEGNAATVVTSASALTIGAAGLQATPTFSGNLIIGQRWVLWALPTGQLLEPVSDAFESLHLDMFFDGTRHRLTGGRGTFSLNAEAGQYATIDWDFVGQYHAPVDAALPTPTFETTLPPVVELARLRLDDYSAVVNALSFTQGNDIQPRPDVNAADGYAGVRIVDRKPEGGLDPEAALVASHDFWGRMSAADRMPFQMRVGRVAGNRIWLLAPGVQYSGLTYRDRNGLRAYDAGLKFTRQSGNDEIMFLLA
jgi:hypothetical protein